MIRRSERARRPRPDGYREGTAYGAFAACGAWLAGVALLHLGAAGGAGVTERFALGAALWVWLGAVALAVLLGLGLVCGPDRCTPAVCLLGVGAALLHPQTEYATWAPAPLEARVARITRLPRGAIRDGVVQKERAELRRMDGHLFIAFERGRDGRGRVTADVRDPSRGAALRGAVGRLRMFEGRTLRSVRPLRSDGGRWHRCEFGPG